MNYRKALVLRGGTPSRSIPLAITTWHRICTFHPAMFLLDFLARVVAVLRAAATPAQIAAGFVLGMAIGFTPSIAIAVLIALLLIVFNVNLTAAFLAIAVFRAIAWLFDPLLHWLGYTVLVDLSILRPLWTALYDTPFVAFTGYNNTVVMGGLVLSTVCAVPVYTWVRRSIVVYRERYDEKVKRSKVVRIIRATPVYRWYEHLRRIGDELW
jgi:uncharacterized protein (TIGR03546 family)